MARFTCKFISYILKRSVDISVIIPSVTIPESIRMRTQNTVCSHVPKEKYPVLYLFHGMGNNHMDWLGYTKAELYAEEKQIALVSVSAENKRYIEAGGDDYFHFFSKELPEFVCSMFPVSNLREHSYIAGLSMGGYGTFVHAFNFPERFCAVGTFSAAVNLTIEQLKNSNTEEIAQKAYTPMYNPNNLARNIKEEEMKFPKIYMACGCNDPVYQNNIDFRDELLNLGADVTWDEEADYGHEWRFWDMEMERFLNWIPRTDIYAKAPYRKV